MKAVVYAVEHGGDWEARFSIAWEVDRLYWGDADFRKVVTEMWQSLVTSDDQVDVERHHLLAADSNGSCIVLKRAVPLGLAEVACNRWNAIARRRNERGEDLHRTLLEAIRWAAARAGEPEVASGWRKNEVIREVFGNIEKDDEAGMRAGAVPFMSDNGIDGDAVILVQLARRAVERLRGCSLLYAEVLAALEVGESELRAALQLAALLGGVRLAAAVAPDAPGVRRLRRSAAAMRCLRCGSREEQLHRTPCATCGRVRCAYCEACLTMGRCRECGLLAIGSPVSAISFAHRQNVSATSQSYAYPDNVQRLTHLNGISTVGSSRAPSLAERWGLSPAQQEAAGAALAYLHRTIGPAAVPAKTELRSRDHDGQIGTGCLSVPASDRLTMRLLPMLRRLLPSASIDPRLFLLWAVTGAGKTEMMFPLLDAVLSAGGRVAVATPRRDVVLELAPRLAAAFPTARLAVLYGGSEDRFIIGDLTLATTHQLIRFQEAFDLVVIDEVDAFPYHNDAALHYAAAKSRARSGMTLLLSATPPPAMQRQARRGRLPHARVAVRYHRRPLPVPQRLAIPPLARWTAAAAEHGERRRLPARLRQQLRASVHRGAQLFLFVPYIRQVQPLVGLLRQHAAEFGIVPAAIDGTSSQDAQRGEKVRQFRACAIRLLVTTTILERGVTIPRSDVYVLDADKPLFDAASLVQMAGRAGRSADDPHGGVYFAAAAWTQSQRDARRQIREMNSYARRKGYLIEHILPPAGAAKP